MKKLDEEEHFHKVTERKHFEELKNDHRLITLCAFRYGLGRKTYIVSQLIDWILHKWEEIPDDVRGLMVLEVNRALEKDAAGDECDRQMWKMFLDFAKNYKDFP